MKSAVIQKKRSKEADGRYIYLKAKAYMMHIPSSEFLYMPIGELSDLIDAADILNGLCDEDIPLENDYYIPIELR